MALKLSRLSWIFLLLAMTNHSHAIVNGAIPNAHDPMARRTVLLVSQLPQTLGFCTGDLLPNQIVVTAAHCLEADTLSIQVIFAPSLAAAQAQPNLIRAARIWKANENFFPAGAPAPNYDNDIGLIKFDGQAPPDYETFFLPEATPNLSLPHVFLFSGFGAIDAQENGSHILRTSLHSASDLLSPIETARFAMDESITGTCYGDSGGPLALYNNGRLELLGVNSSGIRNTPCVGGYATYTSTLNQKQWIQKTLQSLFF